MPIRPDNQAVVYPPLQQGEDRLIPVRRVIEMIGLSKAMIYRLARAGTFPAPCKVGGASSRWSEREVLDWRAAQLAARGN